MSFDGNHWPLQSCGPALRGVRPIADLLREGTPESPSKEDERQKEFFEKQRTKTRGGWEDVLTGQRKWIKDQ